jgi:hypothetical protein
MGEARGLLPLEVRAERGAARDDQFQRGEVVLGGQRVADEGGHDRRGHAEHRDAVAFDQGEELRKVEAGHRQHRRPRSQRHRQRDHEAHDVKKGATASVVSRSVIRSPLPTWRTLATRLEWVSMTPLGSPVVPLE